MLDQPQELPVPGWLRRQAWLLVLVGGLLAYFVVLRVMVQTDNVNFFPSLLLIGAITPGPAPPPPPPAGSSTMSVFRRRTCTPTLWSSFT